MAGKNTRMPQPEMPRQVVLPSRTGLRKARLPGRGRTCWSKVSPNIQGHGTVGCRQPDKPGTKTFQDREFSWYAEEKFLEGAYATFLGVSFQGPDFRSWQAAAVGDCCLFQLRNRRLLRAFPVRHADAFGNQPDVIGSRKSSMKVKRLKWKGDWQKDDKMFLMTDALAQYFLKKTEDHQKPAKEILSLESPEAFETWIAKGRQDGDLRNDDVTLMVIGG
jgi:hypothetical protein